MGEWKRCKLGDVLEKITKGTTPPKGKGFVEKGINYIKSDAISYNGRIDVKKFSQIDEVTHNKFKRSQLEEDDILLSMAGVFLGKNAIVRKEFLPANTNQALAILRLDKKRVFPEFVSLYFRQKLIIDFINNMSGQSAQPNINFQEISSIELYLPSLPKQKAIAEVLSRLDDKIDLLHRQNKTLESMTETLFRQWFVPARAGEPHAGGEEAKEGWEDRPLSFFGEIVCGKTPSKKKHSYFNGQISFVKIPDMHGQIFLFKTTDSLTEEGKSTQVNKTLPPKSICVSCIATVGLVSMNVRESQTNQQINSIIPKKDFYRYFLYLTMKSSYDLLHSMASGGTATFNLNTGDFSNISIQYSGDDYLKAFQSVVKSFFDKIFINQSQIHTIEKLRNTLLPRLMSGEVRVKCE